MTDEKMHGEGNHEADERYREGVRKTVEETSEEERADAVRNLSDDQEAEDRNAREKAKQHDKG